MHSPVKAWPAPIIFLAFLTATGGAQRRRFQEATPDSDYLHLQRIRPARLSVHCSDVKNIGRYIVRSGSQ